MDILLGVFMRGEKVFHQYALTGKENFRQNNLELLVIYLGETNLRPCILLNSFVLKVTNLNFNVKAVAAIIRS